MTPAITYNNDRLSCHFDRFDISAYSRFLQLKAIPEFDLQFNEEDDSYTITAPKRFAAMLGESVDFNSGSGEFSSFLFDDQASIVSMALEAKRFACWSDCGLGKTLVGLEFAKHIVSRTKGRVLIVTMPDIVNPWIEEAANFYSDSLPVAKISSRAEMKAWCIGSGPGIAATNYEKFNPDDAGQTVNECRHLAGIVLDESSRLKTGGGKQKWALIKSCKGIEYKLSLTATPAPNDTMEFASQASFLERMRSESEIIWTYFTRHPVTKEWTVKPHARKAFFEFMSTWSIYVRDPRKYGWRLNHKDIPMPEIILREIPATAEQMSEMQKLTTNKTGQLAMFQSNGVSTIQRAKMSQIAKGFRYLKGEVGRKTRLIPSLKPGVIADIVGESMRAKLSTLIWTIFDAEGDILSEELSRRGLPHHTVSGRTKDDDRLRIIDSFRQNRESGVLIGKASMLGFGMNFQNVGSMIFSGWNDSFEQYYQALRRAYRHGQTRSLKVYIPVIQDLEHDMLETIFDKEAKHIAAIEEMENLYIESMRSMKLVNGEAN